ncbi:MAG TPA: hypothetical protein VFE42_32975, partial [Chloroflexota bacterium]|nr:hypothetical protein [Chloroflexota bacterium]
TVGETTQLERELLDALRTATTSLFRVLKLSGPDGTLLLEDLLEHKEPIDLTDVGFSRSAQPGFLLFVRLIALPTLTMTSGAGFVFPAELERDLLRRYTKLIKKRGPESLAIRRFVAFFGWNRMSGIEVLFE